MIPVKIEIGKRKFEFTHPESKNELMPNQYRNFIRYFLLPTVSIEERPSDRLMLFLSFIDKPVNKLIKTKWYRALNTLAKEGLLEDLLELQDFLNKEEHFNTWILKSFRRKRVNFVGPKDRFVYMTFGQFIVADTLFMSYFEKPSVGKLNKFIAALYLQDFKKSFGTEDMELREVLLRSISDIDKQGILYNYSGVRSWLTKKYPFVFNSGEQNSTSIVLGKSQQGWAAVRSSLAESVLNLERIDKVLMHDVLADFNEKLSK